MATVETGRQSIRLFGSDAMEVIFEPVVIDSAIDRLLEIHPDVPAGTTASVIKIEALENIVTAKDDCEVDYSDGFTMSEQRIESYLAGVDLRFCIKTLWKNALSRLLRFGTRREDITGTMINDMILRQVRQGIAVDTKRLLFFGNRAGNKEVGAMNGYWSKWIPKYVTEGKIKNTTAFANTVMGVGDGVDYLEALYTQASPVLRNYDKSKVSYYVSDVVWDRIWNDFVAKVQGSVIGETRLADGTSQLKYRGMTIEKMALWEQYAHAYYSGSYDVDKNSNLGFLAADRVLDFSTDMSGTPDSAEVSFRYSEEQAKEIYKSRFAAGSDIFVPELISTAFNH